MQAERQPWELRVRAKASGFDLRIKAAIKHLPSAHNLSRFSIRLKLSRILINFRGKPKPANGKELQFSKSKFCKILERFRIRHRTKKAIPAIDNEGSACRSSSVVGKYALFWQWISGNYERGILVFNGLIFPFLASAFKNLFGRKMAMFLLVFSVFTFSCSILMCLL